MLGGGYACFETCWLSGRCTYGVCWREVMECVCWREVMDCDGREEGDIGRKVR